MMPSSSLVTGMVLTVMVMAVEGDMMIGVTQLIHGYNPAMKRASPNATRLRWYVTIFRCYVLYCSAPVSYF